ncbi:hypothetical protein [Streptomyces sp. NPDC056361]|uniref:hypothetical protein n=1 Tax=Streptomyces sp. NPDC056361 TaxID=3345795 RepID=UPI0035D91ECF
MPSVNLVQNIGLDDAATGPSTTLDDEPTAARFPNHAPSSASAPDGPSLLKT